MRKKSVFFSNVTLFLVTIYVIQSVLSPVVHASEVVTGTAISENDTFDPNAVYTGITIDGDFSDWDAIQKTVVWDQLNYTGATSGVYALAMIWDGDYVYLYVAEKENPYCASWSGTLNNGIYAIKSDLGYTTQIQFTKKGTVNGVDGVLTAHSDPTWGADYYYWELAIPMAALPFYRNTISFCTYADQPLIADVANIHTTENNDAIASDSINCDGLYEDWTYYPHTTIGYINGKGTQGECALYLNENQLYGHMEFTQSGLSSHDKNPNFKHSYQNLFSWMLLHYDQRATDTSKFNPTAMGLTIEPVYKNKKHSDHSFAYTTDEYTILNVARNGKPVEIGRMYITTKPSGCDAEWQIEVSKIAEHYEVDTEDLKMFGMQFISIGDEWVWTAGTDTGPLVGVLICIAVTGCTFFIRRRKRKANVI